MKKYFIVFYCKDNKRYLVKYFENEKDLIKFKNKISHSDKFIIIEDSRDIVYTN